MRFFVGLHQVSDAKHFARCFISVNRLVQRKSAFTVNEWILDSGAFSTILQHGGYPHPVEQYAAQIRRWKDNGKLLAAVTQDYMCEPHMLQRTGLTVEDHQHLTVERYDQLCQQVDGVYILPVLQGYAPQEYVQHLAMYGERLAEHAWVGVGSICKRNSTPLAVEAVLRAIKTSRPDLRLHGFGLKTTALASKAIRQLLDTADSMAWSFAARREGRGAAANDWREAKQFVDKIHTQIGRGVRMPRAKAPVVGVISYFQTAPLEQAQLTLAIVKHVVAAREDEAAPVKRAKPAVPRKERADKGKTRKPVDDPTAVGTFSGV